MEEEGEGPVEARARLLVGVGERAEQRHQVARRRVRGLDLAGADRVGDHLLEVLGDVRGDGDGRGTVTGHLVARGAGVGRLAPQGAARRRPGRRARLAEGFRPVSLPGTSGLRRRPAEGPALRPSSSVMLMI